MDKDMTAEQYIEYEVIRFKKQYVRNMIDGFTPDMQMDYMADIIRGHLSAVLGKHATLQATIAQIAGILPMKTMFTGFQFKAEEHENMFNHMLKTGENSGQRNTPIGISIFYRTLSGFKGHKIEDLLFPGTPQQAMDEIMPQIMAIAGRVPIEADVSGNPEKIEVSVDKVLSICSQISHYYYMDKDRYRVILNDIFELHWKHSIEQSLSTSNKPYDKRRRQIRKHFKTMINRTFANCKKRIGYQEPD